MTWLIWITYFILLVSVGLCHLPAPVNVTMVSHNFVHTLKWKPGAESHAGTRYRVEVYNVKQGGGWIPVILCLNISSPTECHLTEEFNETDGRYRAHVQAFTDRVQSNWSTTENEFTPIDQSILDPPELNVTGIDNGLHVKLILPAGKLYNIYKDFTYDLEIYNIGNQKKFSHPIKGLEETITHLEPDRKYCIRVKISSVKSRHWSKEYCASTSTVIKKEASATAGLLCTLIFLGVIAVACILFRQVYFPKNSIPEVLTYQKHCSSSIILLLPEDKCSLVSSVLYPTKGEQHNNRSLTHLDSSEEEDSESNAGDGYENRTAHIMDQQNSNECLPHDKVSVFVTTDDSGQARELGEPVQWPHIVVCEKIEVHSEVQSDPEPQEWLHVGVESIEEESSVDVDIFSVKVGGLEEEYSGSLSARVTQDQIEQQPEDSELPEEEQLECSVSNSLESGDCDKEQLNREAREDNGLTDCSHSGEEEEEEEPCGYMKR
ncbi:interleukin-10 receptor subunit beta isoform X2 [Amia ocellicauda]|uniref:interleukin-10 receptor subunit beta isoform X2 n=1 Tax=Amia ocellicauda TaxID=2972642 RepID=UPI00346403E4